MWGMEEGQGKEKGKAERPSQQQGASTGPFIPRVIMEVFVHTAALKSDIMSPPVPLTSSNNCPHVPMWPFLSHSPLEHLFKENSSCFIILSISISERVSPILEHSRKTPYCYHT